MQKGRGGLKQEPGVAALREVVEMAAERLAFKMPGIAKCWITEGKVCYVLRYPSFTTASWDEANLEVGRSS